MSKVQIGVSVICMDPLNLEREISLAHHVLGADFLHLDVMDNIRVPRFGMYAEQINRISVLFPDVHLDVHLMVTDPLTALSSVKKAHSVSFHPEENRFNLGRILDKIIEQEQHPGLVLNWPYDPFFLTVPHVTLMGCYPGVLVGPPDDWTDTLCQSIKRIHLLNPNIFIKVDGGVRWDTIPRLVKAGVNGLICGSATVYSSDNTVRENFKRVRELTDV